MIDPLCELSPDGFARKDQILRLAIREAREIRFRRKMQIGALVALPLLALISILCNSERRQPPVPVQTVAKFPVAPIGRPPMAPSDSSSNLVRIIWIQTDPEILKRMETPAPKPAWQQVNDDQLLQALAEAGKPSGLITLDGKVALFPRD
jgi:hypothetical protein